MAFHAQGEDDPYPLQGNPEAFRQIFDLYNEPLCRYIGSLEAVQRKEDIHDIANETWIKVWKAWSGIGGVSNLQAWIWRIAHNTAIDFARKWNKERFMASIPSRMEGTQSSETEYLDDSLRFEDQIERNMMIEEAWRRTILVTKPKQRRAYIQYYLEQRDLSDVAQSLHLHQDSVKVYSSMVRRILLEKYHTVQQGEAEHERF